MLEAGRIDAWRGGWRGKRRCSDQPAEMLLRPGANQALGPSPTRHANISRQYLASQFTCGVSCAMKSSVGPGISRQPQERITAQDRSPKHNEMEIELEMRQRGRPR